MAVARRDEEVPSALRNFLDVIGETASSEVGYQ
jgi:hypothetical protein